MNSAEQEAWNAHRRMANERRPRLCVMTKGTGGYGFHLHGEKGKTGQFIRKVEAGSPAEESGMKAGDRVVAVNGVNVERETHHQVVQRIKALENETRLLVVDNETYEALRSLRLTATEEMAVLGTELSSSSSPAASSSKLPSSTPTSPIKKRENGSVQKPSRRSLSKAAKKEALAQAEAQCQSRPQVDPSELVPRLCHLVRSDTGYGFNLHSERSRPGQYIRSLDPGSPADNAGLRPQDRLIEVNGVNIEGMRHAEVVAFIKKGGDETWLLVVDPETDEHFKRTGVSPSMSHVKDYDGPSISNGSPSPQINGSSGSQSIRSTRSDISSQGNSTQLADDDSCGRMDPFTEIGLSLSATAAEEKMKVNAKEKRKAPQMDWTKKYQLFSNF